jgi:hypothetical protein
VDELVEHEGEQRDRDGRKRKHQHAGVRTGDRADGGALR